MSSKLEATHAAAKHVLPCRYVFRHRVVWDGASEVPNDKASRSIPPGQTFYILPLGQDKVGQPSLKLRLAPCCRLSKNPVDNHLEVAGARREVFFYRAFNA